MKSTKNKWVKQNSAGTFWIESVYINRGRSCLSVLKLGLWWPLTILSRFPSGLKRLPVYVLSFIIILLSTAKLLTSVSYKQPQCYTLCKTKYMTKTKQHVDRAENLLQLCLITDTEILSAPLYVAHYTNYSLALKFNFIFNWNPIYES